MDLVLKEQVAALHKQATAQQQEFCIDMEGAAAEGQPIWQWMGYSRKDAAKRSLEKLLEGVDYQSTEMWTVAGGTPRHVVLFSHDGFKQWGMLAGTERGRQIRAYFIECEKQLQREMSQPTALNSELSRMQSDLAEHKAANNRTAALLEQFGHWTAAHVTGINTRVDKVEDRVDRLESKLNRRRDVSDATRALYERVVASRYEGECPCCGKVKEEMHVDHWYNRSHNKPDQAWLICSDCNHELGPAGSPGRTKHLEKFNGFQIQRRFLQKAENGEQLTLLPN